MKHDIPKAKEKGRRKTRNTLLSLSSSVIMASAFLPVKPASAFDSYSNFLTPNQHDLVINDALDTGFDFSEAALNRVKCAGRNQDSSENGHNPMHLALLFSYFLSVENQGHHV